MIAGLTQSRDGGFPWIALAVPGVLTAVIASLLIISPPNSAARRLADIEAKAGATAQAAGADGNLKAFPAGTVCSGDFTDAMKTQLNLALGSTGLKIESFDVGNTGQAATLQAYHVSVKGEGSYEDALAALNVLHGYRPRIFADTVELHNHISNVELQVAGRLFCR